MKISLLNLGLRRRSRASLAAAGAVILGCSAVTTLMAPAAHADPIARALTDLTSRTAPYNTAAENFSYYSSGDTFAINCYVYGDAVGGPYGTETTWDMISGSGDFVPDALVYTGSNSEVVPRCATAVGTAVGNGNVVASTAPNRTDLYPFALGLGDRAELRCYTTGESVNGPYGTENVWDQLTIDYGWQTLYVPDALMYTGSNSAVVPHC